MPIDEFIERFGIALHCLVYVHIIRNHTFNFTLRFGQLGLGFYLPLRRPTGNTPLNATRANVIQGTDLAYLKAKSSVDSQKPCAIVAGYRFEFKRTSPPKTDSR